MNSIPQLQNQESQIQQLAAQRQLYFDAKGIFSFQVFLVTLGILFSFLGLAFPGIQALAGLGIILVMFWDIIALEPHQRKLTQKAAQIQEAFDCKVLGLEWENVKGIQQPLIDDIIINAERHKKYDPAFTKLKDWYIVSVGELPLSVARIICQKSNIQWDAELRRRYAKGITILLFILFVVVVVVSILNQTTTDKWIILIVVPLMPAFLLGIREYKKHKATSDNLDHMMNVTTSLIEKVFNKSISDEELMQVSRKLQNEIYDHRRTAPLIFDWIYRRLWKENEEHMNKTAAVLIKEYLEKVATQ